MQRKRDSAARILGRSDEQEVAAVQVRGDDVLQQDRVVRGDVDQGVGTGLSELKLAVVGGHQLRDRDRVVARRRSGVEAVHRVVAAAEGDRSRSDAGRGKDVVSGAAGKGDARDLGRRIVRSVRVQDVDIGEIAGRVVGVVLRVGRVEVEIRPAYWTEIPDL